jgi:hypothetical protein
VIRTGNPYPVSPELVAQKEAEAAEAIADAIKIRDMIEASIPTPDLTKTEADIRRELQGKKPPVKLSVSARQRLKDEAKAKQAQGQ